MSATHTRCSWLCKKKMILWKGYQHHGFDAFFFLRPIIYLYYSNNYHRCNKQHFCFSSFKINQIIAWKLDSFFAIDWKMDSHSLVPKTQLKMADCYVDMPANGVLRIVHCCILLCLLVETSSKRGEYWQYGAVLDFVYWARSWWLMRFCMCWARFDAWLISV